ncbi:lymphoid-specific helicase [Megalopta genalis]|uniref:lymphoid-specific helicase n=1 Tax=Megalopta genalis TaxID=115081 RepID=UPI0014437DA3|nr:lymphoid-specific helicase-like [Megalopta genalis]
MEIEKENIIPSTSNNAGDLNIVGTDVKFSKDLINMDQVLEKKRKRNETKTLEEEQYHQEMQEKQYKRLMHLLNRSKFFSNYIVNKIDDNIKQKDKNKVKNGYTKKADNRDENTLSDKKKKKNQDIRKHIDTDVREKIQMNRNKLNLSQEDIYDENGIENTNTVKIHEYFNGELRHYQKEGLQWLKVLYENGINGILADEMGLGKTVQVIALLCHLFEKQQSGPYLIIAPLSTIPNWTAEFKRFAPKLPVKILHGPEKERLIVQKEIRQKYNITNNYSSQPIVLTTFEIPLLDRNFLRSQQWRYIVIDEGHRIKNFRCQLIRVLASCKSMNRLLLTGTPLQNNLAELWSLLNFLLPEIFDDLAVFESWFDAKELQNTEGTKKLLQREQEKHVLASLREILKPFMLRREKIHVCADIPPKKEVIVYAPLTELQHDLYLAVLNRDIKMISKIEEPSIYTDDGKRRKRRCVLRNMANDKYGRNNMEEENLQGNSYQKSDSSHKTLSIWKEYTNVTERNQEFLLNITMHHRFTMYKKIVNHPYLVHCPLDASGLPLINEDLIKSSGKLLVLDLMLAKLKSLGHKILLFSTMTTILDTIEDYLSMRPYEYVRLDGKIGIEEREKNIAAFNSNPNIFLFLLTTRAGGVGLNLAAADTVIIYDSDWNPQMDIQAMARCHRIGQTKPIVIYRLCTKGTVDEIIIKRAEAKRVLEKMVISQASKTTILNKETLLELQKCLESKDCQIVVSKNKVFTEEELNKLLDRSDLYENLKPKEP